MLRQALSSVGLVPLANNLLRLHLLRNNGRARSTRQLHHQLGQGDAAQTDGLTGDAREGSVDEDAVVVDDFHNDGELATVRAVVDEDQATDFNEARVYLTRKTRIRDGWTSTIWLLRTSI